MQTLKNAVTAGSVLLVVGMVVSTASDDYGLCSPLLHIGMFTDSQERSRERLAARRHGGQSDSTISHDL